METNIFLVLFSNYGLFTPKNFHYWETSVMRTITPGSKSFHFPELSATPWNFRPVELLLPRTKVLGTFTPGTVIYGKQLLGLFVIMTNFPSR